MCIYIYIYVCVYVCMFKIYIYIHTLSKKLLIFIFIFVLSYRLQITRKSVFPESSHYVDPNNQYPNHEISQGDRLLQLRPSRDMAQH